MAKEVEAVASKAMNSEAGEAGTAGVTSVAEDSGEEVGLVDAREAEARADALARLL